MGWFNRKKTETAQETVPEIVAQPAKPKPRPEREIVHPMWFGKPDTSVTGKVPSQARDAIQRRAREMDITLAEFTREALKRHMEYTDQPREGGEPSYDLMND